MSSDKENKCKAQKSEYSLKNNKINICTFFPGKSKLILNILSNLEQHMLPSGQSRCVISDNVSNKPHSAPAWAAWFITLQMRANLPHVKIFCVNLKRNSSSKACFLQLVSYVHKHRAQVSEIHPFSFFLINHSAWCNTVTSSNVIFPVQNPIDGGSSWPQSCILCHVTVALYKSLLILVIRSRRKPVL